jgi:acyl-coenzyme A synthetase/AMP-(fatty) acid ligase
MGPSDEEAISASWAALTLNVSGHRLGTWIESALVANPKVTRSAVVVDRTT